MFGARILDGLEENEVYPGFALISRNNSARCTEGAIDTRAAVLARGTMLQEEAVARGQRSLRAELLTASCRDDGAIVEVESEVGVGAVMGAVVRLGVRTAGLLQVHAAPQFSFQEVRVSSASWRPTWHAIPCIQRR